MAVALTLVQTKQMRINVHERNNTKHSTKHSKYKDTHYRNTHTLQNPRIIVRHAYKIRICSLKQFEAILCVYCSVYTQFERTWYALCEDKDIHNYQAGLLRVNLAWPVCLVLMTWTNINRLQLLYASRDTLRQHQSQLFDLLLIDQSMNEMRSRHT